MVGTNVCRLHAYASVVPSPGTESLHSFWSGVRPTVCYRTHRKKTHSRLRDDRKETRAF